MYIYYTTMCMPYMVKRHDMTYKLQQRNNLKKVLSLKNKTNEGEN